MQQVAIFGLGEVERHAPLAAVERRKEAVPMAPRRAGVVAGGRLDLDHLGAELAGHAAGRAHHHMGDLDHPDAVEWQAWLRHGTFPQFAISRRLGFLLRSEKYNVLNDTFDISERTAAKWTPGSSAISSRSYEQRNLSRAADQTSVAQSALSHHISNLEAEFATPCSSSKPRGMEPTAAGERLYEHARIILRAMAAAEREIKEGRTSIAGEISIGMANSGMKAIGVPLMQAVLAKYPNLKLSPTSSAVPTQNICSSEHRLGEQVFFRRRIIDQREIDLGGHQMQQRRHPTGFRSATASNSGYFASTACISGTPIAFMPELAMPIEMSPAMRCGLP